jgi:predicted RNA-binding protein YlxR (DUF448 family)
VRVARRHDGSLVVSRDAPGRGAWLCRDPATGAVKAECLEAAAKRKAFTRAFRTAVAEECLILLRAMVSERANMDGTPSTDVELNGRD